MRFAVAVATVATLGGGCRQLFGIDDTSVADDDGDDGAGAADAPPGPIDASPPVDACTLGAIGSIDRCVIGTANGPLVLSGMLDTDVDPRCRSYDLPGGGAACLIFADGIKVEDGASIVVSGTRPLVLVSTTDVTIDGELDLSSDTDGKRGAAANDASCTATREPEPDLGGGAGGAGGSFAGTGGDGGRGDTDQGAGGDDDALAGLAGPAVGLPARVRGGCPGSDGGDEAPAEAQGGAGGISGGAVWIAAVGMVVVGPNGLVGANGAGGAGGAVQAGGGGGGSGGMILIEAAMTQVEGDLAANGGGGGGGGIRINGAPYSGEDGDDGSPGPTPAPGGAGGPIAAGHGGNGAADTTPANAGQNSQVGAGGGGGAVGFIRIVGALTGGGEISPPPS